MSSASYKKSFESRSSLSGKLLSGANKMMVTGNIITADEYSMSYSSTDNIETTESYADTECNESTDYYEDFEPDESGIPLSEIEDIVDCAANNLNNLTPKIELIDSDNLDESAIIVENASTNVSEKTTGPINDCHENDSVDFQSLKLPIVTMEKKIKLFEKKITAMISFIHSMNKLIQEHDNIPVDVKKTKKSGKKQMDKATSVTDLTFFNKIKMKKNRTHLRKYMTSNSKIIAFKEVIDQLPKAKCPQGGQQPNRIHSSVGDYLVTVKEC